MNYHKFALPVLIFSSLHIVGCQKNCDPIQASAISGKCVVESHSPNNYSSGSNYQSGSHTTSESASYASNDRNTYRSEEEVAEVIPHSNMKFVTRQQAKSILKAYGVDYQGGNDIQVDGIPVSLNDQKKVLILEVTDAQRTIEAKGRDVVIIGSASKVTIKDRCGDLLITGGKNVVNTRSATQLNIHGDANHLTLGSLGSGIINGSRNRVDWTRSGEKPNITQNGVGNNIAKSW